MSIRSPWLLIPLSFMIGAPSAQAESEIAPIYAIALASIASVTLGELKGNSVLATMTSATSKHQVSLLHGRQDDQLSISRLALRWEHSLPLWQTANWKVSSALEASYGYWQVPDRYHPNHNQDIGLTPLFKWQSTDWTHLYAEVGVGVHLLENTQIRNDDKSTQFQFGDQLALGWENNDLRVGYRYLHISNANIELPNPATDFHQLELGYRF